MAKQIKSLRLNKARHGDGFSVAASPSGYKAARAGGVNLQE